MLLNAKSAKFFEIIENIFKVHKSVKLNEEKPSNFVIHASLRFALNDKMLLICTINFNSECHTQPSLSGNPFYAAKESKKIDYVEPLRWVWERKTEIAAQKIIQK